MQNKICLKNVELVIHVLPHWQLLKKNYHTTYRNLYHAKKDSNDLLSVIVMLRKYVNDGKII